MPSAERGNEGSLDASLSSEQPDRLIQTALARHEPEISGVAGEDPEIRLRHIDGPGGHKIGTWTSMKGFFPGAHRLIARNLNQRGKRSSAQTRTEVTLRVRQDFLQHTNSICSPPHNGRD